MALKEILQVVGGSVGMPQYATDATTRSLLVEKINKAAKEIWEHNDLPGSLMEIVVPLQTAKVVALPSFVGEMRAVREKDLGRPWTLNDLRPRYHYVEWPSMWRNWRFAGYAATCLDITNSAPLTFNIAIADPALSVTVIGNTIESALIADSITLTATTQVGSKSFSDIKTIKTNKKPTYDISILDADGNEIAVVYANSTESRYLLYDVSNYPDYTTGVCMEILYKQRLNRLESDDDVFPVPDYDDLVADKAIQLFTELQEGKEERALMIDKKIERSIKARQRDKEGTLEKRIKYAPNPLYGMFRSFTGYRGKRNINYP